MNRRDIIRALAGAGATSTLSGLTPERLLAIGRSAHARRESRLVVLNAHQATTVSAIADLIIPVTDTPGARDVGVDSFVDLLLAEWYAGEERDRFLTGLLDIDERGRSLGGAAFTSLTADSQAELLTALDAERTARAGAGYTFGRIKRHTIHAYFSSQIVVETVLGTPLLPGRFDGCVERAP